MRSFAPLGRTEPGLRQTFYMTHQLTNELKKSCRLQFTADDSFFDFVGVLLFCTEI